MFIINKRHALIWYCFVVGGAGGAGGAGGGMGGMGAMGK